MAYSNTGTPRFYVDYLLWRKSLGLPTIYNLNILAESANNPPFDMATIEKTFNLNPSNSITLYTPNDVPGNYIEVIAPPPIPSSTSISTRYFAILGHNLASAGVGMGLIPSGTYVINGSTDYDGFSITKDIYDLIYESADNSAIPFGVYRIGFGEDSTNVSLKVGCYSVGNYYDMPHSPDLKLTMTREMDGVKRIRTKGGADLVDHKYIKPAMWGGAGAWELYDGTPTTPKLSRSGRRTWDLSFSYLQDSSVFPDVSALRTYHIEGSDENTHYTENTLLDGDDFYSQVIHKTNGGKLPFIFQPDKDNNNPDQFAICKFDMNSFKFDQVANGVYNVKLKIREVW